MNDEKLKYEHKRTYDDLMYKLNKHGKCALIRPFGWGKTTLMADAIKEYTKQGKKILFLYPTEVVKNAVFRRFSNCGDSVTFMTYQYMALKTESDINEMDSYDIVMCDECHRIGADKCDSNLKTYLSLHKDAKFIGATATPVRMDGYDVIEMYCDGITVYPYGIEDAFVDDILTVPCYCRCSYDVKGQVENSLKKAAEDINKYVDKSSRQYVIERTKARTIEFKELLEVPNVIKESLKEANHTESYVKFIVFFMTHEHIEEKEKEVCRWFKEALPKNKIRALRITCDTDNRDNVNKLGEITPKKNTTDLILCRDMLNMGYHIDSLTGIMMYRGTVSGTVYGQQFGRVLSASNNKPGIIIDLVDNVMKANAYAKRKHEADENIDTKTGKDDDYTDNAEELEKLKKEAEKAKRRAERERVSKLEIGSMDYDKHWYENACTFDESVLVASRVSVSYAEMLKKLEDTPRNYRIEKACMEWLEKSNNGTRKIPMMAYAKMRHVTVKEMEDSMEEVRKEWISRLKQKELVK